MRHTSSSSAAINLTRAVLTGCAKQLRQAIDAGADPNALFHDGTTPLMLAAQEGSAECVKLLLPLSDPLRRNSLGLTALMAAAEAGKDWCLELLLPFSEPDQTDLRGRTALHFAAARNNSESARILLALCDANARDIRGHTPLFAAASRGCCACAKLLLPATRNLADDQGNTAAAVARQRGFGDLASSIESFYVQNEKSNIAEAVSGCSNPDRRIRVKL